VEIEEQAADFEDGGVGMVGEEVLEGAGEHGRGESGSGWSGGGKHLFRWSAPPLCGARKKLPAHTLS
jgi:hypothetical protein